MLISDFQRNAIEHRIPEAIRRQWRAIERKYVRETTREKHRAMLIEARVCTHVGATISHVGYIRGGKQLVWKCPLCKFSFVCA